MGLLKITVSGITDTGIVKTVNEDGFVYKVVDAGQSYAGIFAVADGVGGLSNGEIASTIAISNINKWWDTDFKELFNNTEEMIKSLIQCFKKSNKDIISLSKKCATTLSALLIHKNCFYAVHVGDSRIYKYNGKLEQITLDHSCCINKMFNGEMVKKNVLTECLGHTEVFNHFCVSGEIRKNDIFLLCSDGVYKTITDKEIMKFMKANKNDTSKLCGELICEAKKRGERDNITAIAVKIIV